MNDTDRKSIDFGKILRIALGSILVLYLLFCPVVKTSIFEVSMGECVSIAPFGRLELLGIDKAVITVRGETTTAADPELLRELVSETRVATHVRSSCGGPGHCDDPKGKLELYRGDKLVRSMAWDLCCDAVHVYEADATHWLIPWWCKYYGGYVYLSEDLADRLTTLAAGGVKCS
ncbi:MAG: hypothetical protein IJ351_05930 [Oscillospiraceae bacterium]|nr:hypothetical protein [Oscillospiraceae bacterium]